MKAWYEESFGEDYLIIYKHRDVQGARREVRQLIEWLEIPKGSNVFDLCCGMGRHAMALADAGFNVTGLDLSEVLLAEAKERDHEGKIEWLHGDMRNVPYEDERFDAVVNLFTSFGYFSEDEENKRVIHEIARLLKPSGRFLIDYINPEYVREHLVPHSVKKHENMQILEKRSITNQEVRKQIHIEEEGKPVRRYEERVKLYSREQMEQWCKESGLRIEKVYGDYEPQSVFDPKKSPRMILVGDRS